MLALGSNTVHLLLPQLQSRTKVPFISMIELVTTQVIQDDIKTVGIVSSTMTRRTGLYSELLAKHNIRVVLPTLSEQEIVDQVIRAVLAGKLRPSLQNNYRNILDKLIKLGAESIILGCTELPLALAYKQLGIPVYNGVKILTQALTTAYYQNINLGKGI